MEKRINWLSQNIKEPEINIVFQPIISLKNGDILGYEALSQTPDENIFGSIEDIFDEAQEQDYLWELEHFVRLETLKYAKPLLVPPFNKKLFLNVSPQVMKHKDLYNEMNQYFSKEFFISPQNIIFEVTDKKVISDIDGFNTTLSYYKSDNFKVADNAGNEFSNLQAITDFNQNYMKFDMRLLRNNEEQTLQSAIVKGIVEFAKATNVSLIAEGVENCQDLETIIRLGVDYAKGGYIQNPTQAIIPVNKNVLKKIIEIRNNIVQEERNNVQITPIAELSVKTKAVSSDMLIIDAYKLMNSDVAHYGLTIIENDQPVGIITKKSLMLTLSGRYSFTLYQDKPISKIMDNEFLSVDYRMPISIVSELAMDRQQDKLYDYVVVTKDKKFHGTVTIKRMLKKVTELEVTSAKQQNPLTGLPGNIAIEHKFNSILKDNKDFSAVYLDIDNFKPYNDVYGFETGDLVIKLLAKTLEDCIPKDQFIGHIGGDDFLVLFDYHVDPININYLVKKFEEEVVKLYNTRDRKRGYITTKNRNGKADKFPLITVTAVLVNNKENDYQNMHEISEKLASLKNKAKAKKAIGYRKKHR